MPTEIQRINQVYQRGLVTRTEGGLRLIMASITGVNLDDLSDLHEDLFQEAEEVLQVDRDEISYWTMVTSIPPESGKLTNNWKQTVISRDDIDLARERLGITVENSAEC
ncbi:MAG: hypothetical protein R3C11_00645 [Planctomycetaceae bacterium]